MDVAYSDDTAFVSAVVCDSERGQVVEKANLIAHASVPYFPGLLGFREGPLLLRVAEGLKTQPEVFMVDGHGVAHPRRCGLACQFGLATGAPTIGVAKSLLYGRLKDGTIVDPDENEIGRIVNTAQGRKFYVSVGHKISLDTATLLVEKSLRDGHPAPLRHAHLDSVALKRKIGS